MGKRFVVRALAFACATLASLPSAFADPPPAAPPPLAPRAAQADPPPLALERRPEHPAFVWTYPRFHVAEGVATLVLAAGAIGGAIIPPSKNPWTSTSSFDETVRNALRAPTLGERDAARDASDLLLAINVANPFLVDALAATYWKHKSPDVALQMTAIDIEAFALNGALSSLTSSLTTRQRPYGRLCPADPSIQNRDCGTDQRYKSFFSGHSSTSFTAATLVCSHHAHFGLFGGGAGDVLACVGALLAAGTTAVLRVVSDQHYITDVLTGSAVGAFSGLAVPWVFHYRSPLGPLAPRTGSATWTFVPGPMGGAVVGVF